MADVRKLVAVQNDRTGKVVGYVDVPETTACEIIGTPYKGDLALLSSAMPAGNWQLICSQDVFVEAPKSAFEESDGAGGGMDDGTGFDDTYSYVLVGEDYNGTDFVSTPAPKVLAVDRTLPRLDGNDYPFAVQTAQNTYLPLRHAPTSTNWIIPYPGPDLVDADQRAAVLSRGFSAVTDSVPHRGLTSRNKQILNINSGREEADIAANGVKDGNGNYIVQPLPDSDPRKIPLQQWATQDKLSVNPAVCELLGRRILIQKQNSDWTNGQPLLGITLNFENHTAPDGSGLSDEQARMDAIGLVMRGVRLQAIDYGQTPPILFCYDHASLLHFNPDLLSKDITSASGTYGEDGSNTPFSNAEIGVPAYFLKERLGINVKNVSGSSTYMATTNEQVKYIKEFGGLTGPQEYGNSTYDDQTFWQKDAQGKPATRKVNGVNLWTIRTDARRASIMGEICDLLGPGFYSVSEADNFLLEWYRRALYSVGDYDVRSGGQHLAASNVRQPGFEKMGLLFWQRVDAEFKQVNRVQKPDNSGPAINPATGSAYDIIALNQRPLNPDFIEFDTIWAAVVGGVDAIRPWMEPQPSIDTPGKNIAGNNRARGGYEVYNKAQNRLSEVNWIKENVTYPLLGELPIRNFSRDRTWHNYNDEFEKKMLMGGRFCPARADKNGKPWIALCAAYPAQDVDMQTTVTLWPTDASGKAIGGSYVFRLKGRKTYLEAFQLPDDYAGLTNAQWRYQYTDLTGDLRTRTMDWRNPIPTTNLTPPVPAV